MPESASNHLKAVLKSRLQPTTMERAGRLLGRLKIPKSAATPEELVRTAWPSAVGKVIAAHTAAVALVRDQLIVEVEDAIWQRQLNTLRFQIINRLQEIAGVGTVCDIAFRPMIPRIRPQRAEAAHSTFDLSADDADRIVDPVLRRVYKTSRRRATV